MAQATDYVLANQSGANFRSELNSVLAAVVSQNSGSTAPSTTYSYQWWIDTGVSPALLKLRNGANNAWITIGDVTLTNLGLVSTTGATFTGDITLNAQSDVRFADSDSSNYVALQAPSTVSTNVTFTLPSADGTADQVLKTDGLGVLGFASYLKSSGGALTGDLTLNAQSDLRFADSDSSNWVAFQAPATVSSNVTWTLPATDGTSNQALITNGSGTLSWAAAGDVTLTGTQTLTNKTLTDPAITGTILEDIYTISDGAAFEVDPGNGSVQLITLGASRTPKATNFAAGESVTLMVADGTAYTLTWTDSTWGSGGVIWVGGTAPTLATTGYTVLQFWKVNTQIYGARVGDVA